MNYIWQNLECIRHSFWNHLVGTLRLARYLVKNKNQGISDIENYSYGIICVWDKKEGQFPGADQLIFLSQLVDYAINNILPDTAIVLLCIH